MSFAFLPLYTGDYLRDTRHLSVSEHGIYILLLIYCWDQKGPAPLDERQLMGICNARSKDEIEAMGRVLSEFFVRMEDGFYNRRMQLEVERSHAIGLKRKLAGAMGYQAKAKQLVSKCLASASKPPPPSHSSSPPSPEDQEREAVAVAPALALDSLPKIKSRKATRLQEGWFLPDEWRDWAVKVHHLDQQQAVRISLDFRDYWHAKAGAQACKLDWFATWRRWVRKECEDA